MLWVLQKISVYSSFYTDFLQKLPFPLIFRSNIYHCNVQAKQASGGLHIYGTGMSEGLKISGGV